MENWYLRIENYAIMLNYFELRKGVKFLLDGQPHEVLEFQQIKKARGAGILQAKVKNLITGKILDKTFHQGDTFEETDTDRVQIKFLYAHRGKYVFNWADDPSKRFELSEEKIGSGTKFLKPNTLLEGILYEDEIVNILLPIKVHLKVKEAPPGIKGDRAQGGYKSVILETGASINVPLFVETGNIIEINTENEEYVRRVG